MNLEDIRAALKQAAYNRDKPETSFIPYKKVKKIWSGEVLEQFLRTHDASLSPSEVDTVREHLLRIVSIIVSIAPRDWLGWSRFRGMFFPEDNTLAQFRRDENATKFERDDLEIDTFLDDERIAWYFMTERWIYFPEVLERYKENEYEKERRVPLYREEGVQRDGAFGTVTKEVIPPNHIVLNHLSDHLGIPDAPHPVKLIVARKRFHRPNHSIEVKALNHLRASLSSHKRIVSCLAIFSIHNQLNIIMPWAEMDLETFLGGGYTAMASTTCLLRDLICETRKVAAAIHFLHQHLHLESDWPNFHNQALCHTDLKPQNILVFKQHGSSTGIWRITDFGISYVAHLTNSEESGQTSGYAHMMRAPPPRMGDYQAPDPRIHLRSDIWSFGCIMTRVFAFGLNPDSLKELDQARKGPLVGGRSNHCFHVGIPPVLHPSIDSWIEELPAKYADCPHPSDTDAQVEDQPGTRVEQKYSPVFLSEMQKILRSMLQIGHEQRPSARGVRSALHDLQLMKIYTDPPEPSVSSRSNSRITVGLLILAIQHEKMDDFRNILENWVNVEECPGDTERPLIHAIEKASSLMIKEISDYQRKYERRNLDVRTPSSRGQTPLYLAVCTGDLATVEAVIDAHGPHVDVSFHAFLNEICDKKTPLMQAASLGRADVVSLLLRRGADPTIFTGENWNCLHYAVAASSAKDDVIKSLGDYMPFDQQPPDAPVTRSCETPFMLHVRLAVDDSMTTSRIRSMWLLKFNALLNGDGRADINRKYRQGTPLEKSLLEIALAAHKPLIANLLLENGAVIPSRYVIPGRISSELKQKLKIARR